MGGVSSYGTAAMLVGVGLCVTACGNAINIQVDGMIGVSHDGHGGIVVHGLTCDNQTREVTVTESGTHTLRGTFTVDEPQEGYFSISTSNPAPWKAEIPLDLPPDPATMLTIDAEPTNPGGRLPFFSADRLYTPVSVNYEALITHSPDEILVDAVFPGSDNGSVTVEQFTSARDCTP